MKKQEVDMLIDKSIVGQLTQNEKSQLEAFIKEDPTIKQEIKMRTDIIKGLEYNADQELKALLNKIHADEIAGSKSKGLFKIIAVAAISIGIIFGIYFLNKNLNTPQVDNSALYATYFEAYSPSLETRNSDDIQEENYKAFIDAYRSKNYAKSIELFQPMAQKADDKTLFLAGISAMETDQLPVAIEYLDKIIKGDGYFYIDHAKWYKSLVLIKMNKITEAKKIIKDLASKPKADHHAESILLLKEL